MSDQQPDGSMPKKARKYHDWTDKNKARLEEEIPNRVQNLKGH